MLCESYERPFMLRRLAALNRSGIARMAAINPTTKVKGARAYTQYPPPPPKRYPNLRQK